MAVRRGLGGCGLMGAPLGVFVALTAFGAARRVAAAFGAGFLDVGATDFAVSCAEATLAGAGAGRLVCGAGAGRA